MKPRYWKIGIATALILSALVTGCSKNRGLYVDPEMDFSALRTLAVMPFENLSNDKMAAHRVRDMFINKLLATGAVYVLPPGEVARAIGRAGVVDATSPSIEEIGKIGSILNVDAVLTGVVREYNEVRSGNISDNVISISVRIIESGTKKIVFTASSTRGGVDFFDRLTGGGGQAMNHVTELAVDEVLNQLFH